MAGSAGASRRILVPGLPQPVSQPGPSLLELFRPNLILFGAVANVSLARHLACHTEGAPGNDPASSAEKQVIQLGTLPSAVPKAQMDRAFGWTGEDVELAEQTEQFANLRARMVGRGGTTVEGFSKEGLHELMARCGGQAAFDKAVHELFVRVHNLPGKLDWNWFQIGYGANGDLGIMCLTCNDGVTRAIGHAVSNPFTNFIKHCGKSGAHAESRTLAQQLVTTRMAMPNDKGLSRCVQAPTSACNRKSCAWSQGLNAGLFGTFIA